MSEQQDVQSIVQHWSASVKELFYEHTTAADFAPIPTSHEPAAIQDSPFSLLPEDVVVCVLAHCGLRDLVACMTVCRALRTLIQSDTYLLRYRILLAANGMVDGPSGHSNKLAMLLDQCSRVASAGTYCNSHSGRRYLARVSTTDEAHPVVLAFGGTITYVVMKTLEGIAEIHEPSPIPTDRTVNHWFVPLALFPEAPVSAVSADTTQDLLLVVQHIRDWKMDSDFRVHVRSLADPSACHPRASEPILYTATWARVFKTIYSIQIHRQYVAWGLYSDDKVLGARIELWDWQNGLFVWRCDFSSMVSFSVLDPLHIVMAADYWDHLRVYRVTGHVRVTRDILRLNLPPTTRRVRVQESSIPAPPADAPYWPDPELRVIVVAYTHRPSDGTRSRHGGIIIPYTTFVHWLKRIPIPDSALSSYHSVVEWERWGASGSALLGSPHGVRPSPMDRTYPYGSRVSFTAHDRHAPECIEVVTVDLNPYGQRLARNPYIPIPPHLMQTASRNAMAWTPHVHMRHVVHSRSREEPDPALRHPTIVAHPYGYIEVFEQKAGPDVPSSQTVGFRIHTLHEEGR